MSVGGGGEKSTNNQQTNQSTSSSSGVDQWTRDYMQRIMEAAQAAGQQGPSGVTQGAVDYNNQLMHSGQQGLDALSGNSLALKNLMNPYQQNVVDATNAQWDQSDKQAQNAIGSAATNAGAFGGARQGVAQGVAQGQNTMNRNSAISGILSGGYNDAMNRAGQLASGGFAASGANAGLGMAGVGSPQQWLLQMLNQGFRGPTGGYTNSSGSGSTSGSSSGTQFGGSAKLFG